MVSEQYHVNMVSHNNNNKEKDVERMPERKVISKPIIASENDIGVSSVLEYFGITPNDQTGLKMSAKQQTSAAKRSPSAVEAADNIHKAAMYRMPQQVSRNNDYADMSPKHHLNNRDNGEDRSSTTSSFNAWRSNCHPIYSSSRFDELWPKIQRWWNILKWPMVLLLICSILGLFIYFLVVEMKINESLLRSEDNAIESDIIIKESNFYQGTAVAPRNFTWINVQNGTLEMAANNRSRSFKNNSNADTQRPLSGNSSGVIVESTTDSLQKQYGFTSGHQNNFGVPIEDDERILKLLNDELIRIHNGTTTPRQDTTTRGDEYRTKVSPTLPLIRKEEPTTERLNMTRLTNEKCVSTSLPLCRGVLHYDLTTTAGQNGSSGIAQGMTDEETTLFKYLLDSQCSARSAQFMCSLFEPECRPAVMADTLPPCKRFCKSILEPCSQVVANSELLTALFDCDIYPDSFDSRVCNDPTRFSKCLKNEFKCRDSTCIPQQWRCDNIKDCGGGDDEENCKFCEQDEFKCPENDKCIPDQWRCDQYKDCPSGSDELDCIEDDARSFPLAYGNARVYPFVQEIAPNEPNGRQYLTINDERRQEKPIDQDRAPSHLAGRHILVSKSLANFQDSTEIMMTSDTENNYKSSAPAEGLQTAHVSPCPDGELRCLNGRCISLDQLCDKVMDCADGSDEAMCETTIETSTTQEVTSQTSDSQ